MSYFFPEGSKFFYSKTFAAAKTITDLTNADPAVATAVAHGYSDGNTVLVESGWSEANNSVFEVDQITADTFKLQGLDTSNTSIFPAGTGIGSAQLVSAWTEIPQILSISPQGGGPRYGTFNPLGDRQGRRQIIGFEAASLDMTIGHDPNNATLKEMAAISRAYTKVAIKVAIPGGGRVYGYGNLSVSEIPQMSPGNPISITAGVSFDGRVISYGA